LDDDCNRCLSSWDSHEDSLLDEPTEVGANRGRERAASREDAELHVEAHSELGQIGAADEETLIASQSAFHVERTMLTIVVSRSLGKWPNIHGRNLRQS